MVLAHENMIPYRSKRRRSPELDHKPVPLLLYCPDEGGWHTGVWFAGVWRLHAELERVLEPTHWAGAGT